MTVTTLNFETFQGDTAVVTFTVPATDISDVTDIIWTAQRTLSSAPVLTKQMTIDGIDFLTDGTDGKFTLTLTGDDTTALTGYYMHEVQLIRVVDTDEQQTTVITGRMQVGRLPTWTYSGDPSISTKDQIRFNLGDTSSSDQQLQDQEIDWAYAASGSVWGAVAMCALALAAKYSRLTSISADGVSQSLNQKAAAYRLVAEDALRKNSIYGARPFVYGVSIADMRTTLSDPDRVPDIFRLGMNDDPPNDGVAPQDAYPYNPDGFPP